MSRSISSLPGKLKSHAYGIDACSGGWVSAYLPSLRSEFEITFLTELKKFQFPSRKNSRVFIDIPLGLKAGGAAARECDRLARRFLKKRGSCVFPAPVRKAVYASAYEEACRINREATGRALSKQTWNITSKIREADKLLRENSELKETFFESHPEIAFQVLHGGRPLRFSKKSEEGIRERLRILRRYVKKADLGFNNALSTYARSVMKADDILDAMVLALNAQLSARVGLLSLPERAPKDRCSIPMRIVFSDNPEKCI